MRLATELRGLLSFRHCGCESCGFPATPGRPRRHISRCERPPPKQPKSRTRPMQQRKRERDLPRRFPPRNEHLPGGLRPNCEPERKKSRAPESQPELSRQQEIRENDESQT